MGKPESFSNVEDKFKLTLLQIEKRFVDLEMSISEIKTKLKDINIDVIGSLQQRMDDLEDLTMVENVGVVELKKMLENIKTKFGELPATVSVIPKLEERLKKLEASINEISMKPVEAMVEEKMKKLEEIEEIKKEFGGLREELNKNIQYVRQDLDSLRNYFENRMKEINLMGGRPSVDYDLLLSKITSLEGAIEILSDKKDEMDVKFAGLEQKIDFLNKKIDESANQKFVDEMKIIKRDTMSANFRLDSTEKILKEFIKDFQEISKTVKSFENTEKILNLSREMEGKINEIKRLESQINALSARLDTTFENASMLAKSVGVDRIKSEIESRDKVIDKKLSEVEKLVMNTKTVNVDEIKIGMDNLSKQIAQLNEKIIRLNREVPELIVDKSKMSDVLDTLTKRINAIDGRIGNLYQTVEGAKPKEVKLDDTRFSEIFGQLSAVEDKIKSLEKSVRPIDTKVFDEQIEELLGKLVFLESRMVAMEKMIQETTKISPIIIE